ncbi:MAG: methylmalonyl-CoA epimerase [Gemmatimonadota bacterium]|nr:methylmalonyl-CoA epimerase [Gemmatimonadota bacterium]
MPPEALRGARLAHLGIAVRALDEMLPFYRDVLGLPVVPLDDADGARIAALDAGGALIELLEPLTPGSPIDRFISKRGPGIHHICLAVEDLEQALERCRSAGYPLLDQVPRPGADGKRIAFLHPAATGGVLIELTEG